MNLHKEPKIASFQAMDSCSTELASHLAQQLVTMDPWLRLGYQEQALRSFFLQPACDAERYLMLLDEEIAGVVCLKRPWLRGVYLEQLAILPPWQRQGLGRQALDFIEQRHAQYANIWLLVSGFNQSARRFYQANGFVELCPLEGLLVAGEDEILMRKRLAVPQK